MATLNITVDDAQVARVRAAYGAGTNAELRTAIIADIKGKVVTYETSKAHSDNQSAISSAYNTVQAAVNAAQTSAEAISIT